MSGDIIGRGWAFPPGLDHRGRIATVAGEDEIEQSIRIILTTSPGQRVMRPEFGCRLNEIVFAPNNAQTAAQAERFVRLALGRWEPRIQVEQVTAAPDAHEPARLQILSQLAAGGCGPVSVNELTDLIGLSQPTVSHHLKKLTEAGLLERIREGRTVTHRVRPELFAELRTVLQMD